MKLPCVLLVLLFGLSACLAGPLKPSASHLSKVRTLLVVPVESPPLEVTPDTITTRLPIHRQDDNLQTELFLEPKLYRSPGGVLISGLVSSNDIVAEAPPARTGHSSSLEPAASHEDTWSPASVLAAEAVARLRVAGFEAVASDQHYRLPIEPAGRTADLARWQESIRQWYNRDVSSADYGARAMGRVDAVLEVGIGTYRIFYGQIPLQVLVKLIDPATGRVIGRTEAEAFPVEDSAEALLDHEAEKFKQVVAEAGAGLMRRALADLGLSPTKAAAASGASFGTRNASAAGVAAR